MQQAACILCLHCGTPVPPEAADARFCCAGCACVHEMLCSEGLGKFYDLRGAQALAPVSPMTLRDRDYDWLASVSRRAEEAAGESGHARLELAVQGLSCVACVWVVEKVFQQFKGAGRIEIHALRGRITLEWLHGFPMLEFARRLQSFGYLLGPCDASTVADSALAPVTMRLGVCGACAMNAMAFSLPSYVGMSPDFVYASWFDLVTACSATVALLVGGSYFVQRSWLAWKQGILHMDAPIALGILSAWTGSMVGWLAGISELKYFDFVAVFVFLMLAGRWLQQSAVERNRRRLLQCSSVPDTLLRRDEDGVEHSISLGDVRLGDTLLLKPGEVCPVSSHLVSSAASLSLEWINGESAAVSRDGGQAVPSGALNIGTQSISVVAQETWKESLLQRLVKAGEASHQPGLFAGRLLRGYLISVVLLGVMGAVLWWWSGAGLGRALQVMISVFVVSCPCALGVAAPLADDLAASWMQRVGVFVRSNFLWQRLARVRKIVCDKTGTLTLENPSLKTPEALIALTQQQKNALHHLVGSNLHPISRSLFDALRIGVQGGELSSFVVEEIVGQGLSFKDGAAHVWSLGRPSWLKGEGQLEEVDSVFSCDGVVLARFQFEDALRPQTRRAFEALRADHFSLFLLSGDRAEKVRRIADVLGIPKGCWQAELTPEEKARWVRSLNDDDTLYLGDGANDSLALEAALCSGSPVTGRNFLEHKADFYFLGSSLRFLPKLFLVARKRQRAVRTVFTFALIYNACAVALSLAGLMNPLLAAIIMPLSSAATLAMVRVAFRPIQGRTKAGPLPAADQNGRPLAQQVRGNEQPAC